MLLQQPERLDVRVDGTMGYEAQGRHEAKTGCLYWQDEHQRQQRHDARRFCPLGEFGWHMWLAACRCGLGQASEVVYLGDGRGGCGANITGIFSEHVWDCSVVLSGPG